jgi:hypothetical protein
MGSQIVKRIDVEGDISSIFQSTKQKLAKLLSYHGHSGEENPIAFSMACDETITVAIIPCSSRWHYSKPRNL